MSERVVSQVPPTPGAQSTLHRVYLPKSCRRLELKLQKQYLVLCRHFGLNLVHLVVSTKYSSVLHKHKEASEIRNHRLTS